MDKSIRLLDRLSPEQQTTVRQLASMATRDMQTAANAFSASGGYGGPLASVASRLLDQDSTNLANVQAKPFIDNRIELIEALSDPRFAEALGTFRQKLAGESIENQVALIEKFLEVDWELLAREADAESNLFMKGVFFFRKWQAQTKVTKSELTELVALAKLPQFVQMMTLARSYAQLMLLAYKRYAMQRKDLTAGLAENSELVSRLDGIMSTFIAADDLRAAALQKMEEGLINVNTLMEVFAEMGTLEGDLAREYMKERVEAYKGLQVAMDSFNEAASVRQEQVAKEISVGLHIWADAQVINSKVVRAMAGLMLYLKLYMGFEFLMAYTEVTLIATATAIDTMLAASLGTKPIGDVSGMELYQTQQLPLRRLLNAMVKGSIEQTETTIAPPDVK